MKEKSENRKRKPETSCGPNFHPSAHSTLLSTRPNYTPTVIQPLLPSCASHAPHHWLVGLRRQHLTLTLCVPTSPSAAWASIVSLRLQRIPSWVEQFFHLHGVVVRCASSADLTRVWVLNHHDSPHYHVELERRRHRVSRPSAPSRQSVHSRDPRSSRCGVVTTTFPRCSANWGVGCDLPEPAADLAL
jgi:hypothetical protein